MTAVWQQALALDAKFNAYRTPSNPQFSKIFDFSVNYFKDKICVGLTLRDREFCLMFIYSLQYFRNFVHSTEKSTSARECKVWGKIKNISLYQHLSLQINGKINMFQTVVLR